MNWSILLVLLGVLRQGFLAAAMPKDITEDSNKAIPKEISAPGSANTVQSIDVVIDKISDGQQPLTTGESTKSEDKNADDGLPSTVNKKCPGVLCSKPPSDATCQISNDQNVDVMAPIMGELSGCCPFYLCTRGDGSFFTHFGMSTSSPTESTYVTSSGSATSISSSSGSGSGYGYGGATSFNTQSSHGQGQAQGYNYNAPTSNSFMSSSNFGSSSNYGHPNPGGLIAIIPSFGPPVINPRTGEVQNGGRHIVSISSHNNNNRYGNQNRQNQNPNPTYPNMPFMPIAAFQAQAPAFANSVFPNWMRDRRDARPNPFSQQPIGFGQPQNFRPQGNMNIFPGMGHQQQQPLPQYF